MSSSSPTPSLVAAAVAADETYPDLPAIRDQDAIPYESIRYIAGYTADFVRARERGAMQADRAYRQMVVDQQAREHLRHAWGTLHNLAMDMEPGPVRQQMQRRAQALQQFLESTLPEERRNSFAE